MRMVRRFEHVAREQLAGTVGGVYFGQSLSCIARSPDSALFWSGGTKHWSGRGQQSYDASGLIRWWRLDSRYGNIGPTGGRLSVNRLLICHAEIDALFGTTDVLPELLKAGSRRTTLLIDGGGEKFRLKMRR